MLPFDNESQSRSQHLLNFAWMLLVAIGLALAAAPFLAIAVGWYDLFTTTDATGRPATGLAPRVLGTLVTLLALLFATILGSSSTVALRKTLWPTSQPGHTLALLPAAFAALVTMLLGAYLLPISCFTFGLLLLLLATLLANPDWLLAWLFTSS